MAKAKTTTASLLWDFRELSLERDANAEEIDRLRRRDIEIGGRLAEIAAVLAPVLSGLDWPQVITLGGTDPFAVHWDGATLEVVACRSCFGLDDPPKPGTVAAAHAVVDDDDEGGTVAAVVLIDDEAA